MGDGVLGREFAVEADFQAQKLISVEGEERVYQGEIVGLVAVLLFFVRTLIDGRKVIEHTKRHFDF